MNILYMYFYAKLLTIKIYKNTAYVTNYITYKKYFHFHGSCFLLGNY